MFITAVHSIRTKKEMLKIYYYLKNSQEILEQDKDNIEFYINVDKDFDIAFEIVDRISTANQATLISAMDESGSPWPGIVYRISNGSEDEIIVNVNGSTKVTKKYRRKEKNKVVIKRRSGVIYISINDGADSKVLDMTSLNKTFNVPLTIGSSLTAGGAPQRYFEGTLKDINVTLYE